MTVNLMAAMAGCDLGADPASIERERSRSLYSTAVACRFGHSVMGQEYFAPSAAVTQGREENIQYRQW